MDIKMEYKQYEGTVTRAGYRYVNLMDGDEKLYSGYNLTPVQALENALSEAANRAVDVGDALEINVELPSEVKLSDEVKTYIAGKYEADPVIDSIKF